MPTLSILVLILSLFANTAWGSTYWDEYEACKAEGFGTAQNVVCDPSKRLADNSRKTLGDLLIALQKRIGCDCPDGCRRADGTDHFIGLLHVSNNNDTDDLQADVEKEYTDAQLGNATCDHGLMIVYLKDSQRLASYRGGKSFVTLTDADMQKLHALASKGTPEGDSMALQYLLSNYKEVVPVHTADSWMPFLGLVAAILVVMCVAGVLLSLFLAKFCCCCVKNKKEIYQVNTLPSYKTIEPLYVATPHGTHINHSMSDAIYSTPYSGSPMPYPPPPGASVPVTPNSTYRHRVNGDAPGKARREQKQSSEPGSLRRTEHESDVYSLPPVDHVSPRITSPHEIYGTIPRVSLSPRPMNPPTDAEKLPYLDPNRVQEVQTREELIL